MNESLGRTDNMSTDEQMNENCMEITVDGHTHDLKVDDVSNFKDLMKKIELELVPQGKVLTHIYLNGEYLSEEQENLYESFGIEDITILDVKTEEPVKLALSSLNDTLDYLPELAGSFEKTAVKIRSGDYATGLEYLNESLGLIQNFNQLIDGIRQVLMVDFFQIKLEDDEGENFASLNNSLQNIAKEILTAAEAQNWTELADLLEYELSPLLYRYLGAMPFIIEAVNKTDKSN